MTAINGTYAKLNIAPSSDMLAGSSFRPSLPSPDRGVTLIRYAASRGGWLAMTVVFVLPVGGPAIPLGAV
ncbi:MAG: hypothetical protein O3A00_10505 [Planctomycetota bacterium]|nr:hypothetical protein [Planctomycetota bacterium]